MCFLLCPVAWLPSLDAALAHRHSLNDETRLLRKQDDVNVAEPCSSQLGCQFGWRRRELYSGRRPRQEKLSVIFGRVARQPVQSYGAAWPKRPQRFGHQDVTVFGVTPHVEASFEHHLMQRIVVMRNPTGKRAAQTVRPVQDWLR